MRNFFRRLWGAATAPFVKLGNVIARPFRAVYRFMMTEPLSQPMTDILAALVEDEETRRHARDDLNKLRWHIIRSLIVLTIVTALAWIKIDPIIRFLAEPVGGVEKLQVLELTESLGVYMKAALIAGFGVSLLYIAFELWLYIAPGLHVKARWLSMIAIPAAFFLFLIGAWFTHAYILPTAVKFLLNFGDFQANPIAGKYFSVITRLIFWISLSFEFPLVTAVLALAGWVSHRDLLRYWRIAMIGIAVIAAIVTPTTDPGNMALVMAPMAALYFIGILTSFLFGRRKKTPIEN
ncbi:MAG: Sec-independent protein translocase protein TatC [Anaerolineales bacterium]|nr:Sec-independent protein translocase protein TatC [Anaerolineales bacterium]